MLLLLLHQGLSISGNILGWSGTLAVLNLRSRFCKTICSREQPLELPVLLPACREEDLMTHGGGCWRYSCLPCFVVCSGTMATCMVFR